MFERCTYTQRPVVRASRIDLGQTIFVCTCMHTSVDDAHLHTTHMAARARRRDAPLCVWDNTAERARSSLDAERARSSLDHVCRPPPPSRPSCTSRGTAARSSNGRARPRGLPEEHRAQCTNDRLQGRRLSTTRALRAPTRITAPGVGSFARVFPIIFYEGVRESSRQPAGNASHTFADESLNCGAPSSRSGCPARCRTRPAWTRSSGGRSGSNTM